MTTRRTRLGERFASRREEVNRKYSESVLVLKAYYNFMMSYFNMRKGYKYQQQKVVYISRLCLTYYMHKLIALVDIEWPKLILSMFISISFHASNAYINANTNIDREIERERFLHELIN